MRLKTTLVTSNWGDEHMYFRHQRMEDDLKLRPEWEPYVLKPYIKNVVTPKINDDATGTALVMEMDGDCPFLKLFLQ